MRQEKTMKVIINHFMDPKISLSPNGGSDSSFVWTAPDFAENSAVDKVCSSLYKLHNDFYKTPITSHHISMVLDRLLL